jgi:predicted nucleotide-binding protein
MSLRPTVFVGSSAEGIPVLEAIQVLLERPCEVVPWTVIFPPGEFTLESLDQRMAGFDFAVLVMTADDVVKSRGQKLFAPRDNLLLELGLCMGRLGRRRTFVVSDRTIRMKFLQILLG